MPATRDVHGLLHAILTCVTARPGLGFSRAILFLSDDADARLVAAMAIGPATSEEAQSTWTQLANERNSLDELLHRYDPSGTAKDGFQDLVEGLGVVVVPEGTVIA